MSQHTLSNIIVITTGGTIAMKNEMDLLGASELLHYFPSFEGIANVRVEELMKVNSAAMLPSHWLEIEALLRRRLAEPGVDGAVLLHGTDSLEETAFFLHLCHRSPKPVVITGAMRYLSDHSPDGSANLYNAVRLATSPAAIGQGPLLLMNEQIFAARDVMKYHNQHINTFRSAYGPLATIDPHRIRFHRQSRPVPASLSSFDLSKLNQPRIPIIPILADYTGFHKEHFEGWVSPSFDGLVIQSFAGGRRSEGMNELLKEISRLPLPIIIASRIMEGSISALKGEETLIYAGELRPQKARILLLLCLLMGYDGEEIRVVFRDF